MPFVPSRDAVQLVTEAQAALHLTQATMGDRLGISRRTMTRWINGGMGPTITQLCDLARSVHPVDAVLAAKLAAEGGESLESLGLVRPPAAVASVEAEAPPPERNVPPPRPFPPMGLVVDSVVCAAADTLQVTPGPVRELLRVAFTRARDLGLTVDDVIAALSPAPSLAGPPPPATPPAPSTPPAAASPARSRRR